MKITRTFRFRGTAVAAALILATFLAATQAAAEIFRYDYAKGDKFRVLSTVDEEVRQNRRTTHVADIMNRIAFEVADLKDDGTAFLRGEFRTSVRASGAISYSTEDVYQSEYWCSPLGRFEIGAQFYMPVVRNVPTFPDRDLKPGDTWAAPGEERHDFRRDFGIPDPYVIPFTASYRYDGTVQRKGRTAHVIKVDYTIFFQPGQPRAYTTTFPTQIVGFSSQTIYWVDGRPDAYEEVFKFVFDLADGRTVEYLGTAKAEVLEAELMDRDKVAKEVGKAIEGMPGVSVEKTEEGVTIRIENIQFGPESAVLLATEIPKLATIAQILKAYPDRDILVAGHTALAGTAEGRLRLSKQRAQAVADYLIKQGVRSPEQVTTAGYGAEFPIAPNDTEANMSRNRRVEITILEN